MEHKEIAYAISEFLGENTVFSPINLAEYLGNKGCIMRKKAKLVAPTYIQGRKFDKVFHCTVCNGIPYGGVGDDSHFCMVCGAEIEEIVNGE